MTFVGYGGISVRRQGVQGLHVHVGMPSAERVLAVSRGDPPWLPVVLALSANSPWSPASSPAWRRIVRRCSPSCRAPAHLPLRVVRGVGGVGRAPRHSGGEDYTRIWWDIRPHPGLGTLEIRSPTSRPTLQLSAAFAALLQALCASALDGGLPGA